LQLAAIVEKVGPFHRAHGLVDNQSAAKENVPGKVISVRFGLVVK
jgi:hypothetical protein